MRRFAFVAAAAALVALSPSALAQQPAQFTLELAPAELVVIGGALAARPYAEVAALIDKIRAQARAQEEAAAAAAKQAADDKQSALKEELRRELADERAPAGKFDPQ